MFVLLKPDTWTMLSVMNMDLCLPVGSCLSVISRHWHGIQVWRDAVAVCGEWSEKITYYSCNMMLLCMFSMCACACVFMCVYICSCVQVHCVHVKCVCM